MPSWPSFFAGWGASGSSSSNKKRTPPGTQDEELALNELAVLVPKGAQGSGGGGGRAGTAAAASASTSGSAVHAVVSRSVGRCWR